jgi:DNA recombination protein RmuC
MELVILVLVITLLAGVIGLLAWLINIHFSSKQEIASQKQTIELITNQLNELKQAQSKTDQGLQKSLTQNQSFLNKNLQSSQKVLNNLNERLGKLHEANQNMLKVGSEVKKLQDILKNPKQRGNLGEWSLENILSKVLPEENYHLQYSFRNGKTVDAIVNLADYSVPVDAKFPLEGFEKLLEAEDEKQQKTARKQFLNDVINHINKIAENYINPKEGTLDFALMYIPAENVYYETVIKQESDTKNVTEYAMDKKVIPVSPNLLYVYLMTVVMGLHGLQIEKQAGEIRNNLKTLNSEFAKFVTHWDVLGKHIRNTSSKYDEGAKIVDRFGVQLEQLGSRTENEPEN